MTGHIEVPSTVLAGVFLDEAIAPLIDYLAISGVSTTWSCQGSPGQVPRTSNTAGYISFPSPHDLLVATGLLAQLALAAGLDDLAARILGQRVIELPSGELLKNTKDDGLQIWHYELRRYFQPWSIENDKFRATVRVNFEDVLVLVELIKSA